MNDDAAADLIRGLTGRRGARRLLRELGFDAPLEPAAALPDVPGVRAVLRSTRPLLTAWLVELGRRLDTVVLREIARSLRAVDPVRHQLLIVAERGYERTAIACEARGEGLRHVVLDPAQARPADADVLRDLAPADAAESDTAAILRIGRALDRSRVTARFFRDVIRVRDLISRAWSGLPHRAVAERDALALLFLSRVMFLYFLQRRQLLDDDPRFLPRLLGEWRAAPRRTSFFRSRLRTLFFGVLNRRAERRTRQARALGSLPYLNGGLFELHRLEAGRPDLDLPDEIVERTFDALLEKYRFTAADTSPESGTELLGVDPEMLGRIFEGLMPGEQRSRTGTFYTPPAVVGRVVDCALREHLAHRLGIDADVIDTVVAGTDTDAPLAVRDSVRECVRTLRVLDPACGSGAFLLGALARLGELRLRLDPDEGGSRGTALRADLRREIVGRSLHGVDLLEDAALICSLRLWLALVPQCNDAADVPPLPNLDRRIRQGDALIDPFDIGFAIAGRPLDTTAPPELRRLVRQLGPAAHRYLGAGPESRPALRRRLQRLESAVARAWLDAFEARLAWQCRDLSARAADRDLFGDLAPHAITAGRQLRVAELRRDELHVFRAEMDGASRLPFFSFRVHFADAGDGFDLVLGNPPWVRAHNWPPTVRAMLRERYHVCSAAGWPYAAALTQLPAAAGAQVDLSLLFLEKAMRLLAGGGTLAMVLPAKLFRSLYAGGARELLLRDMRLSRIEDHSLDHRAVFDADSFTAMVVASRPVVVDGNTTQSELPAARVRVELARAGGPPLHFDVPAGDLPLRPGDPRSPWLLAPDDARAVFRAMQRSGVPIGEQLTIRRGAMTGANDVLVVRDVEPRLGDLARVRMDGFYRAQSAQARAAFSAYVEGSAIRPVLRGSDVAAWRPTVRRHVLWTPNNDDAAATAPPRLRRYLLRHRGRLGTDTHSIGALHRLSEHTCGHKVVWSDVAADLRAAAVEPVVRTIMGTNLPVVPLNTVYFIATSSMRESLLLAAYLNALPFRAFARVIAERAKDAHFRFFAWTLAVLPLPYGWRDNAFAGRLHELAQSAHHSGGLAPRAAAELDLLVARSYDMDTRELNTLRQLDAWLRGEDCAA